MLLEDWSILEMILDACAGLGQLVHGQKLEKLTVQCGPTPLIPWQPFFTAKVACSQEGSLRFVLEMLLRIERRTASYSSRHVDVKQGVVLRMCINRG